MNSIPTQMSGHIKRWLVALFFIASGMTWLGSSIYSHYYVTTDNAYINATIVHISPKVTGKVINLFVENNQYVKKDQWLFDLDPEPLQTAVDAANAQLESSALQLRQAEAASKSGPAKTGLREDNDGGDRALTIAHAEFEHAKANLAQAKRNLEFTRVTAPHSGWVTNLTLQVGDVVPANQSVFILISDEKLWTDANFKVSEWVKIKPGQAAIIVTDLYPQYKFKGIVESISSQTGPIISFRSPQDKNNHGAAVPERVSVRIRLLNVSPKHQLRIGTSAKVTVELRSPIHTMAGRYGLAK